MSDEITLIPSTELLPDYKGAEYHFDVMFEGKKIGVAVVHHFGIGLSYVYNLAHIEIDEKFRRHNVGSIVLYHLITKFQQLVLFALPAVEGFYIKNGFHVIDEDDAAGFIKAWRIPKDCIKKYGNLMVNGDYWGC